MWLPWEYGVVLAALFGSISWRANPDYRRIAAALEFLEIHAGDRYPLSVAREWP